MAQKKEHVQTHYLPTESYLATRAAALHFPAKQFADMINDQNSVYGMVIDMPINPVTLSTLVVYINGAATTAAPTPVLPSGIRPWYRPDGCWWQTLRESSANAVRLPLSRCPLPSPTTCIC